MPNIKIQNASVISYNLVDDDVNNIYKITAKSDTSVNTTFDVYPLDTNIKRIPILGEPVLILTADSPDTYGGALKTKHYYMNPTGVHGNIHSNVLPDVKTLKGEIPPKTYSESEAGNPNTSGTSDSEYDLGAGFEERDDVGSLQPFLGDVMIEGRFGHSLRFGNTPSGAGGTHDPSWESDTSNDPITILSNGRSSGGSYNKFIIEDVQSDLSSIWLTSSQKVKLSTSNTLPKDIDDQSQFDLPSVILNSDRITLNSKSDYVILSGAKSVAIATPAWAMDMDKMFTLIEGLLQQVADLTSGTATFATGVGPTGPATNTADVEKLLSDFQDMGGGAQSGPPPSSASAGSSSGGAGGGGTDENENIAEGSGATPVDQNNVPNANRLRQAIRNTNNKEKGIELSNGGDITTEAADIGTAVLYKLKELMSDLKIRFTGGNDAYHHKLDYNSRHKFGRGLDFTVHPSTNANLTQVETILKGFMAGNDPNFRFINEYATPTKKATGNHFHISWGKGTEAGGTLRRVRKELLAGNLTTYTVSDNLAFTGPQLPPINPVT